MSETTWVTIHTGPPWELEMLRGALEGAGIPSRCPDELPPALGPLVTGAGPMADRLQVAEAEAKRAGELLRAMKEEAAKDADDDDEYELTDQEEVDRIASRVRLLSWFVFTAPLAGFLRVLYLRVCRESGLRSEKHALTLAAPWIGCLLLGALILALVYLVPLLEPAPTGVPPPPPPPWPPVLPG